MKRVLATLFLALLARPAAAITVDGTVDAAYGPARAVQQVQTQFGDASPPGSLGGSELDAAYARVSGGRLYLMLTGNHEPNFNKLEVFIDSIAGGENKLTGTPAYDYNNGSTWISTNLAGLNFDTDFAADYHLFSRWGGGPGPYEVDFVKRNNGIPVKVPGSNGVGGATVGLISSGSIAAGTVGPNASAASLTQPLDFAINNNNAAGVTGGAGAADPVAAAAVTTGMEFSIALADLGSPGAGSVIKISAMINNGDHNYLSNQVLGGLPAGTGNLGGNGGGGFTGNLSGVDFRQFDGLQYFTVAVPEPSALLLGVVAATGLAARRRKV
jgi:hypothetical protein